MNTLELMEPETHATKTKEVIQLPLGILGFERVKNYVLLAKPNEEPFLWFQMLEDVKRAFLVIPPHHVLSNYQPDISEQDVEFLDLINPAEALVLNIVTLRGAMKGTVNLRGPIVINRRTLIGKQVIPANAAQYAIQHPLPVS
ncbi:MAG TPA: flagellar assembly protein FliW [Verrucomicrobiae bacterium]|jgi:flagellar assembly factor FliW|nr:flagellar assembly protein FliW [Verrucomicrobiae bacterium]